MSKSIKAGIILGLMVLVSACARTVDDGDVAEFVVVEPSAVTSEPTFTGKFK